MKVIKLKADMLREWRQNTAHLVDDEGHLVDKLSPALERALSTVMRSAQAQRKSIEQRVAIGPEEFVIAVTMTRPGRDYNEVRFTSSINGMRIVSGRDVVAAQMLALHGPCQLRAPNGVILKVVQDPSLHRPTFQESQQIAPRPEHCPCRAWGNPHPGTHYPTCQYNRLAPPEERAPSDQVPEEEARMLPTEAFSSLKLRPAESPATKPVAARVDPHAVVVQPPPLDPPESCRNGCLEWATPAHSPVPKGQHHPMCVFAKDWAIKTSREMPRWLVDLRTGEKVRHATNDEIGEAEVTAKKTGSPIIHVEEVPYAVVLESELERELATSAAPVLESTGT